MDPALNCFRFFVGIDWGSQQHRVCLLNREGGLLDQRWVDHNGKSLTKLVDGLRRQTSASPNEIAVAMEAR